MSIIKFNNKQLKFNNKMVNWEISPVIPYYYLSYLTDVHDGLDVPEYSELESYWSRPAYTTEAVVQSGSLPSSYTSKRALVFNSSTASGLLNVRNKNEFTIGLWMKSNTSGASQIFELRSHASVTRTMLHYDNASNVRDSITQSTVSLYNGASIDSSQVWLLGNNANKAEWHYYQIYVNRSENIVDVYVDGSKRISIRNAPNDFLNGDNPTFDKTLLYYSDGSSYYGIRILELCVWKGQHLTVPTEPIR